MTRHKTVLITGASSGLGEALAGLYAEPGTTLLLTGRNAERLEAVAAACRAKGAAAETTTIAVTEREAFAQQLRAWDNKHAIGLAIANAGVSSHFGKHGSEPDADFYETMDINVYGVLNTILPLLPRMKQRKAGQLAMVSSVAGLRGLPSAVSYSISKNAVRAMGEALRPVVKPHGVRVNVVCPGFIRTPMTAGNSFPMPWLIDVEDAARRVRRGLEADRPVVGFPLPTYFLLRTLALLPRGVSDWVAVRMA